MRPPRCKKTNSSWVWELIISDKIDRSLKFCCLCPPGSGPIKCGRTKGRLNTSNLGYHLETKHSEEASEAKARFKERQAAEALEAKAKPNYVQSTIKQSLAGQSLSQRVTNPTLGHRHRGRASRPPLVTTELGHRGRASWPPLPIVTTPEQHLVSAPPMPIVATPELGHRGRGSWPPPPIGIVTTPEQQLQHLISTAPPIVTTPEQPLPLALISTPPRVTTPEQPLISFSTAPIVTKTTPEQHLISTPPRVTTPEQPLISFSTATAPIVTTPELGHGCRATMPPPPPIDIETISAAFTTPGKSKSWVYYFIKEDEEKNLSMCMLCGSYTKCRDNINLSKHLFINHPYEAWQAYTTYKMLCVVQS